MDYRAKIEQARSKIIKAAQTASDVQKLLFGLDERLVEDPKAAIQDAIDGLTRGLAGVNRWLRDIAQKKASSNTVEVD